MAICNFSIVETQTFMKLIAESFMTGAGTALAIGNAAEIEMYETFFQSFTIGCVIFSVGC